MRQAEKLFFFTLKDPSVKKKTTRTLNFVRLKKDSIKSINKYETYIL
jgi:hypothetical protein